jgi:membrane protein
VAGTAYQAFQFLYISGQISVTKYNAIYGSFAAIPLFLLWLQISWTICLFGAELTYSSQNIKNFSFEKDTKNISRRYRDFLSILIMSLICKRFANGETPYTAEDISLEHKIPIKLTNHVLDLLQDIKLVHEVVTDTKSESIFYLPSMDINKISVAYLLGRIDTNGSEDFKVDKEEVFKNHWQTLIESRDLLKSKDSGILLKDL